MRIREPWPLARSKQRRREFAAVFARVPPRSLGRMLELGSGDGFMASMLAPLGDYLVTTEPSAGVSEHATECPRLRCSATALPFADSSFDFIFSSSVLEHVKDRDAAFAEMHRCLRPDGVMVHLMPSTTWKTLQLLFYYPHIFLRGLELIGAERQLPQTTTTEAWRDGGTKPSWWTELKRGVFPQVHGEYRGHVREMVGFRATTWSDIFKRYDFDVRALVQLPLYSGYGFGFERLRRVGERFGMSAHNAFIVTHAGATSRRAELWATPPQH